MPAVTVVVAIDIVPDVVIGPPVNPEPVAMLVTVPEPASTALTTFVPSQ